MVNKIVRGWCKTQIIGEINVINNRVCFHKHKGCGFKWKYWRCLKSWTCFKPFNNRLDYRQQSPTIINNHNSSKIADMFAESFFRCLDLIIGFTWVIQLSIFSPWVRLYKQDCYYYINVLENIRGLPNNIILTEKHHANNHSFVISVLYWPCGFCHMDPCKGR